MQSQGKYDFAIYGENLASWTAALLLAKQGERVLIMPERRERREFSGRILFGLEQGGILLRMLERWGISSEPLKQHSRARMECLTPEASLWIQGSLKAPSLGSPAYELGGPRFEKVLSSINEMETRTDWKSEFEKEFIERVRFTTDKRLNRLPLLPSAASIWKRSLRKALSKTNKGSSLKAVAGSQTQVTDLLRGLHYLLYRGGAKASRELNSLQVTADLFALRNAYFSDEVGESLRREFRRVLVSTGVEFLPDTVLPDLKRDSTGTWEGFYKSEKMDLSIFRFDHLILTRQLGPNSLKRFEEASRATVAADFQAAEFDRYEMEVRFKKNPFAFSEPAELVSKSPSGGWVRLSVYQKPETSVRVGAWIPVDAMKTKGDPKAVAEKRLLREIQESLPGLAIDAAHSEIFTEVHRERRFRPEIGVRGSTPRIWHAHEQSYPKLGEYGPVIAAIEIARIRARQKKRILPI